MTETNLYEDVGNTEDNATHAEATKRQKPLGQKHPSLLKKKVIQVQLNTQSFKLFLYLHN